MELRESLSAASSVSRYKIGKIKFYLYTKCNLTQLFSEHLYWMKVVVFSVRYSDFSLKVHKGPVIPYSVDKFSRFGKSLLAD